MKRIVWPAGMANSPNYSHAVVKQGLPVFIAGQVAIDGTGAIIGEGDVAKQAEQVFNNLRSVLGACGGTMDDVVKITVFTTDLAHRAAINEARAKAFRAGEMPASTFLVISSLADRRFLLEVEAVAMIEQH